MPLCPRDSPSPCTDPSRESSLYNSARPPLSPESVLSPSLPSERRREESGSPLPRPRPAPSPPPSPQALQCSSCREERAAFPSRSHTQSSSRAPHSGRKGDRRSRTERKSRGKKRTGSRSLSLPARALATSEPNAQLFKAVGVNRSQPGIWWVGVETEAISAPCP